MIFGLVFFAMIALIVIFYYTDSTYVDVINTAVEVKDGTEKTLDTIITIKDSVSELGDSLKQTMARYPDVFCINCGSNKKMVYDAVISTKNRHDPDKEISVYWCMKCDIILRIQKQEVHDKVTSVRATIFKNK